MMIHTAESLMATDFGPEMDRRYWCEVVDLWCSPECLFAASAATACDCRCNGGNHGDLRRPFETGEEAEQRTTKAGHK
jgi:hypothetical protein